MSSRHILLALLVCGLAAATGARRLLPERARRTAAAGCLHPFGIDETGTLRVLCLGSDRASANQLLGAAGRETCVADLELREGEQLIGVSCPPRRARMPAATLLVLGLALDVNRADAADLEALPSVGPVLARLILEQRARSRGFRELRELRRVRGIGPARLSRLRGWLCIDGGPDNEACSRNLPFIAERPQDASRANSSSRP